MSERIEVSRLVHADSATLFDLLSDPQGHVAIDSTGMLQDATGDPVTGVGDRFVVHMDRESLGDLPDYGKYDVTVIITRHEPGREIAWTIEGRVRPPLRHEYGYRLEAEDEGTRVTSYYDWSDAPEEWRAIFPVIDESALQRTLGVLDRTARRGYPRG